MSLTDACTDCDDRGESMIPEVVGFRIRASHKHEVLIEKCCAIEYAIASSPALAEV